MAIRCAGGIPAAIGCGEQRFETLKKKNNYRLFFCNFSMSSSKNKGSVIWFIECQQENLSLVN